MDALSWLKGLAAAVIGGVATAISSMGGANLSGTPLNWTQIKWIGISSAIASGAAYLKQSPVPPDDHPNNPPPKS